MREFKFRVWDKETKRLYPRNDELIKEIHFDIEGELEVVVAIFKPSKFYTYDDWEFKKIEYPKLLQYTGLKDKNGKEIYEDDIVKFESGVLGKVVWSKKDAGFTVEVDGELLFFNGDVDADKIEVIGNVFENPELWRSE